jgi:hypothetical protein
MGCHESQGFALEEALAMDVSLLVWSVTRMDQESGQAVPYRHVASRAETAPYWDDHCGVRITEAAELTNDLERLLAGCTGGSFAPRQFVVETLSPAAVYERYWVPLAEAEASAR